VTRRPIGAAELASALASLPRLDRAALLARWREVYGGSPPPRLSRTLLVRALAYRLQEQAHGGLPPTTRRALAGLCESPSAKRTVAAPRPGTVLVREWGGVVHRVVVIEDGVMYRATRYRSLSEVARLITGSRWSGPRFFGLKAHASD